MADRTVVLSALALVTAIVAVLVVLTFRVDSNTDDAGSANRQADRNAVSISDLKAIDRRVSANTRSLKRKANRNQIRGVRTQRSLTTLNRLVLGTPGATGLAGRSIEGPRGVTGLTTTGPQGLPGSQGVATNGTDGKDAPPAVNGTDGKDSTVPGPKGDTGDTGPQGPGATDAQVQAVVAAYLQTHTGTCDLTPDPLDSPTAMACTFP